MKLRAGSFISRASVGVVLIALLAAGLRLRGLGHQSLWYDEVLTTYSARAPMAEVVKTVRTWESSPPGYFFLINVWARLFGSSEASLRTPSALFGVGSVVMIYLLGRRIFPATNEAWWVAALILALSRYHIAYSQEARPYSMAFFLALVSCHAVTGFVNEPGKRWPQVSYVLSSAAMLWVQPFTVFVVLGQNLWMLVQRGVAWRRWAMLQGAVILLFGPWLAIMLEVASAGHVWLPKKPPLGEALLAYADGIPLLVVFVVLVLIAAVIGWRRRERGVLFALLLATLPVALPVVYTLVRQPIFTPRYGLTCLIGMSLLVGYAIASIARQMGRASAAGLVVILIALMAPRLWGDFREGTNAQLKPDMRAAAQLIAREASPGDGVAGPDMLGGRPLGYYLARSDLQWLDVPFARALPERIWLVKLRPELPVTENVGASVLDPLIQGTRYRPKSEHEYQGVFVFDLRATH